MRVHTLIQGLIRVRFLKHASDCNLASLAFHTLPAQEAEAQQPVGEAFLHTSLQLNIYLQHTIQVYSVSNPQDQTKSPLTQ